MSTTHNRVIPRDFFNEAKLLKCFGLLALKILDNDVPNDIIINIEETGEPFKIKLLNSGDLTISNYPTTVNGVDVTFKTVYNSKNNYPFFCELNFTDYEVFNDDGEFNDEFIEQFSKNNYE